MAVDHEKAPVGDDKAAPIQTASSSNEYIEHRDSGSREGEKAVVNPNSPNEGEKNKVTFAFFMTMLGFSMAFIVAEVLPLVLITAFTIIAYDLKALDYIIWILVAPYISTGAIAPFVGTLSDLIGRKALTIASLVITIISMIICGTAPNLTAFLAGQVLTGIGIGIQLLNTIAAASELVPVSKRGATIGYLVMGFFPFAPASLYGQLMAQTSWRWIFCFVGIWATIATVVLYIFYNPPPTPALALPRGELLKRIDYVGSALSTLGVILFLIGLNWGGQYYPWNSVRVICMLVFGIVCFILFAIWEIWGTKFPMFPRRIIRSPRMFIAVSILALTSGINFVPLTVFWTVQCYSVYGGSFAQAGVWLLPIGFCIAGGAVLSAIAISVFAKHIHWVILVFCIMQTVGIATMSVVDPTNINTAWPSIVFGLIGVGAVLLPSQVVFSIISPDDLIGTSVALSLVVRMIGQVVGKTMFYNIFRQNVEKYAYDIIAGPAIAAGFGLNPATGRVRPITDTTARITFLVETMTAGPLDHYLQDFPELLNASGALKNPRAYERIVQAGLQLYGKAFPLIYYVSIPFGTIACISCFALWGIDKFMDDHVAVHLV